MQASLASRLQPAGGPAGSNGTSAAPVLPFAVLSASRALPSADGYVFPVRSATIRVAQGVPHDTVVGLLLKEGNVRSVHPNTIMSIVQSESG
jgi:hypothetical protein